MLMLKLKKKIKHTYLTFCKVCNIFANNLKNIKEQLNNFLSTFI